MADEYPMKRNSLADVLMGMRDAIPENELARTLETVHGPDGRSYTAEYVPKLPQVSLANMLREGLGTAAGWMDWRNKISPDDYAPQDVLAPLGAATFGSAPVGALGAGAMRRFGPSDYKRILEAQRATEGMRAAMRDPETGKIYTGWTHQQAIDSIPPGDTSGAWGRLSGEWDRGTDNTGFIDRSGRFVSRSEAGENFNVQTMEDLKDLRKWRQP